MADAHHHPEISELERSQTRNADGAATVVAPWKSPVHLVVGTSALAEEVASDIHVRCSEVDGDTVVTSKDVTYSDITSTGTVQLDGLGGQGSIGKHEHTIRVDAKVGKEAPWAELGRDRLCVYRTVRPPAYETHLQPLEIACRYANGSENLTTVGNQLRSGPRMVDGFKYKPYLARSKDPLAIPKNGQGECGDYAQYLLALGRALGMRGQLVTMWGGLARYDNLAVGYGGGATLVNTIPHPALPPTSEDRERVDEAFTEDTVVKNKIISKPVSEVYPQGFAFTTHVVTVLEGLVQDSALNREGVETKAFHAGLRLRYTEPRQRVFTFDGVVRQPFKATIERRDEVVGVVTVDDDARDGLSKVRTPKDLLEVPHNTPHSRPYEYPVSLEVTKGTPLVPGLHGVQDKNSAPALLGTPISAGTDAVELRFRGLMADSPFKAVLTIKARA